MEAYSIRFPDELMGMVEEEAKRRKLKSPELLRQIVEAYFKGDAKRENMKTLMFELKLTQAMFLRLFDPHEKLTAAEVQKLKETARGDVEACLEERRKA